MKSRNKQTPVILPSNTPAILSSFSRKQVKEAGKNAALSVSAPTAYAMAKRLSEFAAAVMDEAKASLSEQLQEGDKVEAEGCTIYFRGGGFKFRSPSSYEHDEEWQRLKAALEAREELMRTAAKQAPGAILYDSEGTEVPRAIEVAVSPSLMCDF